MKTPPEVSMRPIDEGKKDSETNFEHSEEQAQEGFQKQRNEGSDAGGVYLA